MVSILVIAAACVFYVIGRLTVFKTPPRPVSEPTPETIAGVRAKLAIGDKLGAIGVLRRQTGLSLADGLAYVDALAVGADEAFLAILIGPALRRGAANARIPKARGAR